MGVPSQGEVGLVKEKAKEIKEEKLGIKKSFAFFPCEWAVTFKPLTFYLKKKIMVTKF